jgi:hypothetical protein
MVISHNALPPSQGGASAARSCMALCKPPHILRIACSRCCCCCCCSVPVSSDHQFQFNTAARASGTLQVVCTA